MVRELTRRPALGCGYHAWRKVQSAIRAKGVRLGLSSHPPTKDGAFKRPHENLNGEHQIFFALSRLNRIVISRHRIEYTLLLTE